MRQYAIVITVKSIDKKCVLNERYTNPTDAVIFGTTFIKTLKNCDIDADFTVCELKEGA